MWCAVSLASEVILMAVEILGMAEAGRLHPAEPTARPLEDAGRALADLVERRVTGKVVLVP